MNDNVRCNYFVTRAHIVNRIRQFLDEHGFTEAETPVANVIPGGTAAKLIVTRRNELSVDLYVPVAPKLLF